MGKGGGPIGAIFRGVKNVVSSVGKTIMGGLGKGQKRPRPTITQDTPNTAAASIGMRQRQIGMAGRTSTILGGPQGVTEDANASQARLG